MIQLLIQGKRNPAVKKVESDTQMPRSSCDGVVDVLSRIGTEEVFAL